MNIERLINRFIRQVTRRLVDKGVDAGIDMAARQGKSHDELTEDERLQANLQKRQGKEIAKRTRQVRRITRRFF